MKKKLSYDELEKRNKLLEEELASCKAKLESIVDNLPFVTWIKDADRKYISVNKPFLINFNKSFIEVIGRTDGQLFPNEISKKSDAEDLEIIKTRRKILFQNKQGERWLETYKAPVLDNAGNVTGIVGIQRDVSELRKAMENLRFEHDILQALMDNIPYTIYFKDLLGRFIRINQAQAQLFGLDHPDEAIGKTDFDYFSQSHAQQAFLDEQEIIKTGKPLIDKTEHIRNSKGEFIWVSATKMPMRNSLGEIIGIVGVSIDVTEKHIAEQKLLEARKKAIESDKLKSVFLANMSHEIRTPMNGIIGFLNLLKMEDVSAEHQKEYLSYIEKCGNSLLNLIDDIIDISKIEAGQLVIRESNINIDDILHELYLTFDNIREEEKKQKVELRLNIPGNEHPGQLHTDPHRFKQVVTNLIGNALKFTEEGFIEFGYSKQSEKEYTFFVKDTGVGIPKDKFNLIFDRFGQVLENERLNQKGTGLGLAISINIVKLLGGKMWLESEVGKGSAFYFTLPVKGTDEEDITVINKTNITNIKNIQLPGKKLLIVDDEELNWLFMRDLLTPTRAELIWAKNGREAVDICQYDPQINMVFMDFRMPEMNGYEATKAIRSFDSSVPIIALTAYAQEEDRELCLNVGCNDYLSKPVRNEQLVNIMVQYFYN